MSTIASPRDPSTPTPGSAGARRSQPPPPLGLGGLGSPTGSARPSLDTPPPRRSASLSPGPGGGTTRTQPTAGAARSNRAALREFYNIKSRPSSGVGLGIGGGESGAQTPTLEVTDELGAVTGAPWYSFSEVPVWPEVDVGSGQQQQGRKKDGSQVESSSFDADAFVNRALAELGLDGLLRLYARVLGEIRALDAEKKALVYDNYSKLISATETIRKMRANMDPLNPMASTLDPAIAKIYAQAASIREDMRKSVEQGDEEGQRTDAAATAAAIRQRTKRLAIAALETPARLRKLVQEGRLDEARAEWEMPRRLLLLWKKQGVGGDDVDACIEEGDAALRGEDSSDEQSSGKTDSEA